MTNPRPKNLGASIHQRLLNKARQTNKPFAEVLQNYAMERYLYRLSVSKHAHAFILKGALLLRIWQSPDARTTMDIDMLCVTTNAEHDVRTQIQEIIQDEVESDGLLFDPSSIQLEPITEESRYSGHRVRVECKLDTASIIVQIDIGFGDSVYPNPQFQTLPVILNQPAPVLLCYSLESAIAEKLDAMIKHGEMNSRMKDFYDVWQLSRQHEFDGLMLSEAIKRTIFNRDVALPVSVVAFTEVFAVDKQPLWTAFRKRLGLEYIPTDFRIVVRGVSDFLQPVLASLTIEYLFDKYWSTLYRWSDIRDKRQE